MSPSHEKSIYAQFYYSINIGNRDQNNQNNEVNFSINMSKHLELVSQVFFAFTEFLSIYNQRQLIISIHIQLFQKLIQHFIRWKSAFKQVTAIAADFIIMDDVLLLCFYKRQLRLMIRASCNDRDKSVYRTP